MSENLIEPSPQDPASSRDSMKSRLAELAGQGVLFVHPESVYLDPSVVIEPGARIYPGVILEGETKIGAGSVIYAYCHLRNAVVERDVVVDHCSVIRDSTVQQGATVGPFAHLRKGALVGPGSRVGNFVEVKNARLGEGTKAAHLTYLGDAEIGRQVNIGAGTITCNYDGVRKNKTVIEDGAFIGSDSQLVAPVTVGRGAYVAAGSCITEDVPSQALAIARSRQTNKPGWVRRRSGSDS